VFEVTRASAHLDHGFNVESLPIAHDLVMLALIVGAGARWNVSRKVAKQEGVQLCNVLQLYIAAEQESGVIRIGGAVGVQALKIAGEISDSIGIKEETNHVTWLQVSDRLKILCHRTVVVVLRVQRVAVTTLHVRNFGVGCLLVARKLQRNLK